MVSSEWLKKTELFGGLDEARLSLLLSQSIVKSYPPGETIFLQGEEAASLYVLIQGAVDLTVKTQAKNDSELRTHHATPPFRLRERLDPCLFGRPRLSPADPT